MKRLILAAGVAALAITAPAISQPGERGGKDRGAKIEKKRGEARAQRVERREQRAERSDRRVQRAERAERRQIRADRAERRQVRADRAERTDRVQERRVQRLERAARPDRLERIADRRAERIDRVMDRRADRLEGVAERRGQRFVRTAGARDDRLERIVQRDTVRLQDWDDLARGGIWVNGCPPGLAKKPVACVPPGQVKNVIGEPVSVLGKQLSLQQMPAPLRVVYADTPDYYYRYGNGYAYRINRESELISALIPLFGLGLTAGQPFPSAYSNYYLPASLQPFYANSPYDCYRYANGYVYEIDCVTGIIEDVDPLLGYGYGYGQMMPLTYSAYNVPYQYRNLYYDTPDHYYRYAPGAIYQVDPTTSLITAVAALLTGGLTVGQPLPMGYNAYNVPYAYRTSYYDTPDAWYRYSNGYIYRVDPATQLVTAIVASALT